MRFLSFLSVLMVLSTPAFAAGEITQDKSAVRIMVYFNVGRDEAPATNVTIEQFKAHLEALKSDDYNVLALPDIMDAYQKNKPLPHNAVAITFDGGDKSILQNAAPLLAAYQFPYTVFIAPSRAAEKNSHYLTWNDIKILQKNGLVNFGLHPEEYHAIGHGSDVSIRTSINNATARFRDNIGFQPDLFSYPFGEYTKHYKEIISTYGFKAALGQQSGVAYQGADMFALPRFTMTEDYANQNRFEMTANALPLPIMDITPSVSHITDTTPAIGFTVTPDLTSQLERLSCFASGQERPHVNILGNRVEIRLKHPINQTRFRVNCTLPVQSENDSENKHWRWFGTFFNMSEAFLEPQDDAQNKSTNQ